MTNEQLAWNIQNGNRAALTELWGAVRPLLFSLAWKFYTRQGKERCAQRGVTLEDLQQETFFALCDAVQAYKPEKGYQLTTYLSRATENRFRACMGIQSKADALNHADRLERPITGRGGLPGILSRGAWRSGWWKAGKQVGDSSKEYKKRRASPQECDRSFSVFLDEH